jgi:hypothetical protein
MKWIKKYETFVNDDNRGDEGSYPKSNALDRQKATEYVDNVLYSNKFKTIMDDLKIEPPKDLEGKDMDEYFDKEIREKAIDYYAKHGVPGEVNMETYPVNGGDGIPRTNNVGGTSHTASFRIGENKVNFDHEIEISDDEMRQFAKEEPLQDLIRSGKVRLTNKKVHFNKKDQETIDTLDMYLEIDKNTLKSDTDETHQENK